MPNVFALARSRRAAGILLAAALAWPVAASAEVVKVAGNGFTVRETAEIAAAPEKVYEALVKPEAWWSSDHTFSGSAANLKLDANAGGCFCETLPNNGTVKHQEVVLAAPGKALVMRGALGPLQATGTIDAFAFELDPGGSGTKLTVTFTVGGYVAEGFDDWAKKTDFVIATQAARLKQFVETGSPEAKK
jgi:uncharacterized protein YndB with AHSA1/START domain